MAEDTTPGQEIEPVGAPDAETSTAVAVAERPGVPARMTETPELARKKDRLWLPFLIPVGAILTVALFTINISRIFIAASEHDSTPAVVIGVILTLAVLIGATVVAAIPKLRTSTLILTMSTVTAVILLSGSVVLGASEPKEESVAEPVGEAVNTLELDAFNFRFQADNFDVPAGINELKYVSKEGTHTLAFTDPQFSYVLLSVPGGKDATKITAIDGEKYEVYCTLPGHRAAGMEATITVGTAPAGGGTPEAGTETPSTTLAGSSSTTAPSGTSEVDPASQSGNETGN